MCKSLFIVNPFSDAHILNLKRLDKMLNIIYNSSNDGADIDEIFSNKRKEDFPTYLKTIHLNTHDPEINAIQYLTKQNLVYLDEKSKKYYCTYEGILKLNDNSFENTYKNEAIKNHLLRQYQNNAMLKNNISIVLSILAMLITIIKCN